MVLDAASGLTVACQFGTSCQNAVHRAAGGRGDRRPAAPLPKVVPQRIPCPSDLLAPVGAATARLSKLASTTLVEGIGMWDAEEIVDGLVGHFEGRTQPLEPPCVPDWRQLYEALESFLAAAPWHRWSDSDYFPMRFEPWHYRAVW